LELISGKQPYAEHQQSWQALRDRLGATTVTLSGLADDAELVVRFTPDGWPVEEVPLSVEGWLGEFVLNGSPVDASTAQELVWVERFAGNEDLDATLRRRLDIYADRVERTHRHVNATTVAVNEILLPIVDQLRPLDPDRLLSQQSDLAEAETAESDGRETLGEAISRHRRILEAIEHARVVDAANEPAAELAAERTELQRQLSLATQERDEIQARVEETAERLKREGDAQGALADAQRIQRYRAKRLRNLTNQADSQARQLNIEQDADRARTVYDEARGHLEELRSQRAAVDAGGQTARLIDRVDGLLVSADTEGLDEQELVVIDGDRLTVRQVREGMRTRAEELRSRPLPEELQALDEAIREAQRRAARLATLVRTLEDLARQEELLDEADREVATATDRAETAGVLDETFREDSRRLGQLEEQIDQLGTRLAELYEQMGLVGGQSLEDAQADLDAELADLGIDDPGSLTGEEQVSRRGVEEATTAVNAASDRAANLRRAVTVVQAAIDAALSTLHADPVWRWVAPGPNLNGEDALSRFADVRSRLLALDQRLEDADRLLESFRAVATAALDKDDPLVGRTPRVAAVRRVLGNELRGFLNTPRIRAALFGGAQVTNVDPLKAQLTLATPEGASTRPFESFSTGEQAFAFTQARIRELVAPDEPNRLLVLDEFGAFVAADRLPALIQFLNADALGAICDQVLVVLPLQVDYEADLEFTTGALADRYRERAAQIQQRGYCAVPLTA
jgi:hypothetical protein